MNIRNSSLISGLLVLSLVTPALAEIGDDPLLGKFMLDKFETSDANGDSPLNWELDAWLGKDINKFWVKSEGRRIDGETEQSNELLFSRAIASFWDIQLGLRQDRAGPIQREFFSVGVQGLAPYFFNTTTSVFAGENGQFGLSAQFEYELMLTQRWILSPEFNLNFWSQDDREMGVGSGLAAAEAGLRIRYEIRREFAPYIGIRWNKNYGNTADFVAEEEGEIDSTLLVAGVRIWF
jgi:copper resistance protein B